MFSPCLFVYSYICLPYGVGIFLIGSRSSSLSPCSFFSRGAGASITCPHPGHLDSYLSNKYPHSGQSCMSSGSIFFGFGFPIPFQNIYSQSRSDDHSPNSAILSPPSTTMKSCLNILFEERPPRPTICNQSERDFVLRFTIMA